MPNRFFFVPVVAVLLMGGTANINGLQAPENPFLQMVKPGEQPAVEERKPEPAKPVVEERREPAQPRVGRETRETVQRPERPMPAPAKQGFPFGTVVIWLVLAAIFVALVKLWRRPWYTHDQLSEIARQAVQNASPAEEPRPEAQTRRAGSGGSILGAMLAWLACVVGVGTLNAAPAIRFCDPDYSAPGIDRSVTCTGAELGAVTGVAFGGSLSAANFTKPAANKIMFDLAVPAATAPGGYVMELVTSSGRVPSGFTFVVWDRREAAFLFELDKRFTRKGEAGSDPVARQRLAVLERRTQNQGAQIERLEAGVGGIKSALADAKSVLDGLEPRLTEAVASAAAAARDEAVRVANSYTNDQISQVNRGVVSRVTRVESVVEEVRAKAAEETSRVQAEVARTQEAFGNKALRQQFERDYKSRVEAAKQQRREAEKRAEEARKKAKVQPAR